MGIYAAKSHKRYILQNEIGMHVSDVFFSVTSCDLCWTLCRTAFPVCKHSGKRKYSGSLSSIFDFDKRFNKRLHVRYALNEH